MTRRRRFHLVRLMSLLQSESTFNSDAAKAPEFWSEFKYLLFLCSQTLLAKTWDIICNTKRTFRLTLDLSLLVPGEVFLHAFWTCMFSDSARPSAWLYYKLHQDDKCAREWNVWSVCYVVYQVTHMMIYTWQDVLEINYDNYFQSNASVYIT